MTAYELTGGFPAAKKLPVKGRGIMKQQRNSQGSGGCAVRTVWNKAPGLVMAGTLGLLGGCVNVAAPDKPIVIELNINIRQEVVYRLDAAAAKTIEQNKDIF